MKKLLFISLSFIIYISPQTHLYGQQLTSFEIKKPFKRSTYNGIMIKKMKPKQLKKIISLSNDPDPIRQFNSARILGNVGTTLFIVGTIGVGGSLVLDIIDNDKVKSGNFDIGSSSVFRLASIAVFLAGLGFNISSNSFLKKSVLSYNKSASLGKSNMNHMLNPYGITELVTFRISL